MLTTKLHRLTGYLSAFAPASSITHIEGTTVQIQFDPGATPTQQSAANAALANFDWSDAADVEWLANLKPNRKTLREQKDMAIDRLNQIINFSGTPSAAQIYNAVKDIAIYTKHLINRTVEID